MTKLRFLLLILICIYTEHFTEAYSVITHIAIIDSSWNDWIVPTLHKRFPNASDDEIKNARKFAYGGCIIQDLGFYPHGNKLFSDLVHYVRSGEFVEALVRESKTPDDYAFALGALSHYSSDNLGHSLATNRAVPILYPKLRKKYGDEVTFDEKPSAHLKVEFGYDVVQVARGNYLSDNYHDFIGFDVARDVLKKAFHDTYGLEVEDLLHDFEGTIGSYRYTVTGLIPDAIKIAWELKKDDIEKLTTRDRFFFRMPRTEFEKVYGKQYKRPSFFSKILAFCVRILPGIGPLGVLKFKAPTPEVEEMFLKSYEVTLKNYRGFLTDIREQDLKLADKDLDTGRPALPGEYPRTDRTYAAWVDELSKKNFTTLTPAVQENILSFYSDQSKPLEPRGKKQKKLMQELAQLRTAVESRAR